MCGGHPYNLAYLFLLFISGFFIGRLLSGRFIGAMLTFFLGIFALILIVSAMISGIPSLLLIKLSENLSSIFYYNFGAAIAFIFGLLTGWRRRHQ